MLNHLSTVQDVNQRRTLLQQWYKEEFPVAARIENLHSSHLQRGEKPTVFNLSNRVAAPQISGKNKGAAAQRKRSGTRTKQYNPCGKGEGGSKFLGSNINVGRCGRTDGRTARSSGGKVTGTNTSSWGLDSRDDLAAPVKATAAEANDSRGRAATADQAGGGSDTSWQTASRQGVRWKRGLRHRSTGSIRDRLRFKIIIIIIRQK